MGNALPAIRGIARNTLNAMKKKEYIKPEIAVLQMETQAILAVSGIEKAKEADYSNENIYNLTDGNGNIFID